MVPALLSIDPPLDAVRAGPEPLAVAGSNLTGLLQSAPAPGAQILLTAVQRLAPRMLSR